MIMHILRYLVLLTVFFGLAYVVYQYMGEENVQPTAEDVQSTKAKASASFAQKPEVFVQLGHSGQVTAVAISHDTRFVLSGSKDNTLKLWDRHSGREIRTFKMHFEGRDTMISAVAFSPDSRLALSGIGISSGNYDETIKLWDVHSGHEIRAFKHSNSICCVAFSPNGQLVVSGDYWSKKPLILWDVASGRKLHTFQERHSEEGVYSVAFSPDGSLVLSGNGNGTIDLWEVYSGYKLRTFTEHSSYVSAVAFSHDGTLGLSGSHEIGEGNLLKLWDIHSGQELRTFRWKSYSDVDAVAFSHDSRLVLSSGEEDTIIRWDIENGREFHTTLKEHFNYVRSATFSPDGSLALLGSGYRFLKLFNVDNGQVLSTFKGHSSPVSTLALSPDGHLILSVNKEHTLNLWNVQLGKKIRSFRGHSDSVNIVAFSPDNTLFVSVSEQTIKLWNTESGRELRTFKTQHSVVAVTFSPDGRLLALLAKWGSIASTAPLVLSSIMLWDVYSGHEIKNLSKEYSGFSAAGFSPDSRFLYFRSFYEDTIALWDIKSGRELHSIEVDDNSLHSIAFSPDSYLASWDNRSTDIKVWNMKTELESSTLKGHLDTVISVKFSPDGHTMLSGSLDNTLKLWNIETRREIRTLKGHLDDLISVNFAPNGKVALSVSEDSTIRLWNVKTGKEIVQMVVFEDNEWVTITPDGYYQASLNGAKYLNVCVGNQVYGIDQYEAIYHRPDIVQLALKLGDSQQAVAQLTRNAPPVQIAQVQPPKVWFVAPQQGYQTDRSTITVNIETEEIVDSAESVIFKVNGRPVGSEKGKRSRAKVAGVNTQSYHRQVPLQIGDNRIGVEVRGKSGAVQRASILVIRKGQNLKKPDLYFLGIGVADHPILPLKYSVKDVTQLAKTFKRQRGRVYKQVFIKTLTNQQATRVNLIQAITTFFKDAKQGDIAIVYVSGHGMNTSMGYHFLTYDADPDILEATGASWETFNAIYDLPAHVFLWVDTCRAGNIVGNTDWKNRAQEARPDIFLRDANNRGVIVFASSSGSDVSQEDKRWGHSAFAKALLDGLNGEAADKKGRVPFDMLRRHVFESVEKMTDGLQKPTIPRITGSGAFLDLVLAKK
jgi:WD40 repeat protein